MEDLELNDLNQFYGSENYFNIFGFNVTDGIKYIMDNGYGWFVTDMLSVIKCSEKPFPEFLAIKLKVENEKGFASIEDGNGGVFYTQEYAYTDAKKDLTLFFYNNTLMLNKEY